MAKECSVCFDVPEGEYIYKSSCGHVFHNSCMIQWLATNNTCPVCRTELYKKGPENEQEDVGELPIIINYDNAYNSQLVHVLDSFINDTLQYPEDCWEKDDEGHSIITFYQRNINGEKKRIYTMLRRFVLNNNYIYMAEISLVQDLTSNKHKYHNKIDKYKYRNQKKPINFNYYRNRRYFVGNRHLKC